MVKASMPRAASHRPGSFPVQIGRLILNQLISMATACINFALISQVYLTVSKIDEKILSESCVS